MYKPILTVKNSHSKEEEISVDEKEAGILYCLTKGLVLKEMTDVVCLSYNTIRKRMRVLYAKAKLKRHTEAALVWWMAEKRIYQKLKKWIKKQKGLEEKINKIVERAAYVWIAFSDFSDGMMDLLRILNFPCLPAA